MMDINQHCTIAILIGFVKLWRAVVSQAISDAYLDKTGTLRDEVLEWMESEDFEIVCDLAFINPDGLKKNINRIVDMNRSEAKHVGRQMKELIDRRY